jgi:hypothetical protein
MTPLLPPLQGFVPDKATLLDVSMAGPLWGSVTSGVLLLTGLGLSAAGLGDVTVDSPALADSFLIGLLGQFVLGDALASPEVICSFWGDLWWWGGGLTRQRTGLQPLLQEHMLNLQWRGDECSEVFCVRFPSFDSATGQAWGTSAWHTEGVTDRCSQNVLFLAIFQI